MPKKKYDDHAAERVKKRWVEINQMAQSLGIETGDKLLGVMLNAWRKNTLIAWLKEKCKKDKSPT